MKSDKYKNEKKEAFFKERSWISYPDENGVEVDRESGLGFQKIDDIGYAVKLGYEKTITSKTYFGARMDFTSYVGEDGYIGLGVVIGLIL